jgi:hypothetical protein
LEDQITIVGEAQHPRELLGEPERQLFAVAKVA